MKFLFDPKRPNELLVVKSTDDSEADEQEEEVSDIILEELRSKNPGKRCWIVYRGRRSENAILSEKVAELLALLCGEAQTPSLAGESGGWIPIEVDPSEGFKLSGRLLGNRSHTKSRQRMGAETKKSFPASGILRLPLEHSEPSHIGRIQQLEVGRLAAGLDELKREIQALRAEVVTLRDAMQGSELKQQRITDHQQRNIEELQELLLGQTKTQKATVSPSSGISSPLSRPDHFPKPSQRSPRRHSVMQRLDQLEAKLSESAAKQSILLPDLKPKEREVLQAILDLPKDAFAEAERTAATLVGEPMTAAFANSLKSVLRAKSWGVACETCHKPASFAWLKNARYAENGQGYYSHSGPSAHGWMTTVPNFKFIVKLDRRRRQK